jgi:hypothetical protein
LISGNLARSDAVEQMIEQRRRNILPPNLRHSSVDRKSRGQSLRGPLLVPLRRSR